MKCGSESYAKTKDETVWLLNNYHVIIQLTQYTTVKE